MIRSLLEENVKLIYGYPGGAIMPVFDCMHNYKDRLKHVLVRHEQGATHAAQGFARVSGETGVVLVTSGPAATNIITGVADAMAHVVHGEVGVHVPRDGELHVRTVRDLKRDKILPPRSLFLRCLGALGRDHRRHRQLRVLDLLPGGLEERPEEDQHDQCKENRHGDLDDVHHIIHIPVSFLRGRRAAVFLMLRASSGAHPRP